VSKIEDFPVLHSARSLERQGFKVDYLDVDGYGFADIDQLRRLIGPETILVSIQHANQEIGTVQDIRSIGNVCRENGVLFHCDATHTFTRVPIDVREIPVDLITVSAHTIHGPKGIGGLYVRKGTSISKIMDGGFQEFDLRGGMENIPGAVGFAKAVELVTDEENERLKVMRDKIIESVCEKVPDVVVNGHSIDRTPQNANITFHYVEGESITLHLDMYGIAVSTGSACFSRSLEGSHVITGIGGDHERAHGSIRFTLGRYNTMDEISYLVETLAKIVGELRRISPLGKE
jgi:cysteine desulfurase